MVEIKDLYKSFGKYQVLNGLNIDIPKGALYGFVGPNGAGKTTTIKILTGLLMPDRGLVKIDGVDVTEGMNELKKNMGYVPDTFGVYDNLKVKEYMEFFASCYGMIGLKARTRYMTLLEQVGLEDKADFYVDGLSRGMKKRLCLARALIHDPLLLVLDEPSSGLDPRTQLEYKEILNELREQGKTIFISSHALPDLSELCTDIGIIDQGKIILSGNMEDILRRVNTSNPLIISIIGDKKRALSILRSQPCVQTIAVKDKDIRVKFIGDDQDAARLLQQLVDTDVMVNGFYREQGSLEKLFMQLTDPEKEKAVLVYENKSNL